MPDLPDGGAGAGRCWAATMRSSIRNCWSPTSSISWRRTRSSRRSGRPSARFRSACPGRSAGSRGKAGIVETGHGGDGIFRFDCEGPRHQACSPRTPLPTAPSPMANGPRSSPMAAIADPRHWLSDGWAWVQGARHHRAALLGAATEVCGPGSGSTAAARSTPPRRLRMSAFTKRTPMPAGRARACRPNSNGKRLPLRSMPASGNQLDSGRPGRTPPGRRRPGLLRRCVAMDRQRLSPLSRLQAGRGARSANIMASS